jgi:hypothetical protein
MVETTNALCLKDFLMDIVEQACVSTRDKSAEAMALGRDTLVLHIIWVVGHYASVLPKADLNDYLYYTELLAYERLSLLTSIHESKRVKRPVSSSAFDITTTLSSTISKGKQRLQNDYPITSNKIGTNESVKKLLISIIGSLTKIGKKVTHCALLS